MMCSFALINLKFAKSTALTSCCDIPLEELFVFLLILLHRDMRGQGKDNISALALTSDRSPTLLPASLVLPVS